jgi:hypothetical protein
MLCENSRVDQKIFCIWKSYFQSNPIRVKSHVRAIATYVSCKGDRHSGVTGIRMGFFFMCRCP